MSVSLLRNTFWQFLGRSVSAGTGLLLIPLGLHYFTAEQYGVIGVYLSYVAVIGILSLGLPAYVNRELSMLLAKNPTSLQTARLVRSYEVYFLGVTLLCYVILLTLSYLMPRYWLQLDALTPEQVTSALSLAALTGALRFPGVFYNNILYAQERHKLSNMWLVWLSLGRLLLTFLLLEYGAPTLENFFYAQIIFYFLEMAGLWAFFWRDHAAQLLIRPDFAVLSDSKKIAFSMMAVTVSGHIKTQSDKIILTYLLPLGQFGIYSAAYSIAMGIVPLAYSVVQASFPVMNKNAALENTPENDTVTARNISHSTLLLLAVTVPASLALIMWLPYMLPLIERFSQDAKVLSDNIRIMLIGTTCYVLALLPYTYHISRGKPNILLWVNLALIPPYMVMIFFLVKHYELIGASWSLTLLQGCYVLTHYIILLPQEHNVWRPAMKLIGGYVAALAALAYGLSLWPVLFSDSVPVLWVALINCTLMAVVSLAMTWRLWKRV